MQPLRTNGLKQRLRTGEPLYGIFVEIPSPAIVEVLGIAGFDFVIIDREHGPIDLAQAEAMIRAVSATSAAALVRAPRCEEVDIRLPLDMGAAGVHVPQIASAAAARLAVESARFHPTGKRGLQPYVRAASYGAVPPRPYTQTANEETIVVLHVEGEEGVAALDGILEVEGVDVLFIGPYDLSQSLGIPGEVSHPSVRKKMEEIVRKCTSAGRVAGTYWDDLATIHQWRDLGIRYFAAGMDGRLLLDAARERVERLR